MEETITVDAETPVVDTKKTGTSTNFTQDELSQDPELARPLGPPAHGAGRRHGPREHRRQRERPAVRPSRPRARPARTRCGTSTASTSPTWRPSARRPPTSTTTRSRRSRSRPAATTSASSTGGVGLNFVTKRGTNAFHGTLRGYFTHEDLGSANTPDELKNPSPAFIAAGGAGPITDDTGQPQPADRGLRLRPRRPDHQGQALVLGLLRQAGHPPRPLAGSLIDKTLLKDYNAKLNWQASGSDMVSVLWFLGAKEKFGRAPGACAGCVEPRQRDLEPGQRLPRQPVPRALQDRGQPRLLAELLPEREVRLLRHGLRAGARSAASTDQAGIAARLGQTFGTTQLSQQRPAAAHGQRGRQLLRERHGRQPRDQVRRGLAQDRGAHPDAVAGRPGRRLRHRADQPARARQPRGPGHQPDLVLERATWATPSPRTG